MKAYKFRSPAQFEFALDMVEHGRLYCSDPRDFNDIEEADLRVGDDRGRENDVIDFSDKYDTAFRTYRVCSLCRSFDNSMLWAYYADGYRGIAIEVDVPDEDCSLVRYDDGHLFLSQFIDDANSDRLIRSVLSKKGRKWSHENEVRIISQQVYYMLALPIARIIIGSKTPHAQVKVLWHICKVRNINLERVIVADWGMYTGAVQDIGY